ncbi:MAG: transposase [Anaerovoracaceae bacterium]|jgi:hypothetical protein
MWIVDLEILPSAMLMPVRLKEKWDRKYPSIMRSWDANWAELTTFFNYPEQIRHLIYTTNAVEAYQGWCGNLRGRNPSSPQMTQSGKWYFFRLRKSRKSGRSRQGTGQWRTVRL